jgi:hypothetical protein
MLNKKFQEEVNILLQEIVPDFKINALFDYPQMAVLVCPSFISFSFTINKQEWQQQKNDKKAQKDLVETRLLFALESARSYMDIQIEDLKNAK